MAVFLIIPIKPSKFANVFITKSVNDNVKVYQIII